MVGWENSSRDTELRTSKCVGEGAAMDVNAAQKWKDDESPVLVTDYTLSDVFNSDELGLFYKCSPHKTYALKDKRCKGARLAENV